MVSPGSAQVGDRSLLSFVFRSLSAIGKHISSLISFVVIWRIWFNGDRRHFASKFDDFGCGSIFYFILFLLDKVEQKDILFFLLSMWFYLSKGSFDFGLELLSSVEESS